jgi:limonene-1,2-epoxide hydrolase
MQKLTPALGSHAQFVQQFLNAISRNNKSDILSFFDEASVFNNIPLTTVTGLEGIWSVLEPLHKVATAVEYEVLNIAETSSGAVLTERVDRYTLERDGETITAEFLVMGTFVVEEGSDGEWVIRQWRDYFDINQCLAQLPEELHAPEVTSVS